ncbi:MAG: DUF349 domain-containing protein [Paludibacteraceae bacterium]|nr:DUF349 domain-containing protein [Paludibacteraceae bacterium]
MENEKQSLVEELKGLLEQNVSEVKEQVEQVKSRFYRVYHQELEEAKKAAEEAAEKAGETLTEWVPPVDEAEQQLRELLNQYKQKRQEMAKKAEEEMAQNLLRKENILNQMKEMAQAESADVMSNLQKMRDLQAEWKTIGSVPPQKSQEIWKQYQLYQEQFYDLVKINIELRDLDFKKNLEAKTLLCEAAEKLQENENIVEAGRALQQLHNEWAEIGPVARELREDLWNRFKAASTVINKRHQAYFDSLHEQEQANLEKKKALIEQLKGVDLTQITTAKQWNEAQQTIQSIQDEWRKIGFAPRKQNQAIYEEYRNLCNAFYKARTAYFKDRRDELNENLKAKRSLIDRATEILNSEDWQEKVDEMRNLQREWKTVGPVLHKLSDELWQQFTSICDQFFEKKRGVDKTARTEREKARTDKTMQSGDRSKLMRLYENLQQEIKTAENNILFFTGKSKSGNRIVEDMQKKIDLQKQQLKEIEAKIYAIDNAEAEPAEKAEQAEKTETAE